MALTDIEGIGETTAARILREFGSEEDFLEAARRMEVDRIAAIDGLSGKKAVDIVLRALGRDAHDFLRTPRAERLHEDVCERIARFASTTYAKNRIQLLVPLQELDAIRENLAFAMDAKARAGELPRDEVARLLKGVRPLKEPRPKYDSSLAILVDAPEDYERLVEAGVDRHAQVLTPEDAGFGDDFDVIVYAYSQGRLDLEGADNIVPVPFTTDVARLVPDAVLHRFRANRAILETVGELSELLGRQSAAPEALELLDRADDDAVDFASVEQAVRDAVDEMNAEIKEATGKLSLSGDEVLAMMGGQQPKKVQQVQSDALAKARERLIEQTGEDLGGVFKGTFPLEVDEEALERRRREVVGRRRRNAHRTKVEGAQALAALQSRLEAEIRDLLEFDYAFAVGCFALHYDLHPPEFGEGFQVEGALHLNLPREEGASAGAAGSQGEAARQRREAVPVDYHVGLDENVVLLTGANSGGKTTLLETLAQVTILAHMGLPVNARRATVEVVEAVYFFTQKRSLDAGAFESFLKGFMPIVTTPARKLVLADELEAMTELEAAGKIIGTFIELLQASDSTGVIVTHMAQEVAQHAKVRIDGIEARGLDEDYNLIVDRTPRIGYRARSTPELILQRLANRARGDDAKVYERILEKFGE